MLTKGEWCNNELVTSTEMCKMFWVKKNCRLLFPFKIIIDSIEKKSKRYSVYKNHAHIKYKPMAVIH